MRSEMIDCIVEGAAQMLHKVSCLWRIAVIWCRLVKNRVVACLLDVSSGSSDKPQRVIVEAWAYVGIALFGERLVLMISRAILKLCGCNVEYSLSCSVRNQMHEAQQILTGIPKAHASSDAWFKIRSRAAHVKCHHALILMPYIYHAVKLFLRWRDTKVTKQLIPVSLKLC